MDWVYFVQAENGLIKIGWATRPAERFSALKCASPVELRGLGLMPAGPDDEALIHIRFDHLRVRGEWFRPGDDLMTFIRDSASRWPAILRNPRPRPAAERLRAIVEPDFDRRMAALMRKHWRIIEGGAKLDIPRGRRSHYVEWWRQTVFRLLMDRGATAEEVVRFLELSPEAARSWIASVRE